MKMLGIKGMHARMSEEERQILGMLAAGHRMKCIALNSDVSKARIFHVQKANRFLRFGLPPVEPKVCVCRSKRTVWSFGGP